MKSPLLHCYNTSVLESNQITVAGCDEAGRGCLAGPVFAAAVILPRGFYHPMLNDSKKLSEKQREILRSVIEEEAVEYGVASVSSVEIDSINILNASIKAMHLALDKLSSVPGFIIVDGNRFNIYREIKHSCIVGGDGKYTSIAAASVLAKSYRDQFMKELAKSYPHYNWSKNMGYPTKEHRNAIFRHGISEHHRRTFRLLTPNQLQIFPQQTESNQ